MSKFTIKYTEERVQKALLFWLKHTQSGKDYRRKTNLMMLLMVTVFWAILDLIISNNNEPFIFITLNLVSCTLLLIFSNQKEDAERLSKKVSLDDRHIEFTKDKLSLITPTQEKQFDFKNLFYTEEKVDSIYLKTMS